MNADFFYRLYCYEMIEEEKTIWFYDNNKNVLCEVIKETGKVNILSVIDDAPYGTPAYISIQKLADKIVLIPWSAIKIAIYDLKIGELYFIALKEVKRKNKQIYNANCKFYTSFIYDKFIYLLGCSYPAIIRLNMDSLEMEYIEECISYIEKRIEENTEGYFICGKVYDDIAWISCGCSNLMIKFHLTKQSFEYYTLPVNIFGFGAFIYDGTSFWISEWGKGFEKIMYWNPQKDEIDSIHVFDNEKDRWCPIHSIVDIGDRIILFPMVNIPIYEIEKKEKSVSLSNLNNTTKNIVEYVNRTILATVKIETFIRYISGDFYWHEYDFKRNTYIRYEVKLSKNEYYVFQQYTKKLIESHEILDESKLLLPNYLEYDFFKREL